jgi:hypothetical protein
MLNVEFALALKLRISPIDLDQMDFAEVKSLHDLLDRHLKEVQKQHEEARQKAMSRR